MQIQQSLEQKLRARFSPLTLEIENESHMHHRDPEGETHFRALIVAAGFEGLSRVERQQAVMALFAEERAQGLHALSLRTLTPAEWEVAKLQAPIPSPTCRN